MSKLVDRAKYEPYLSRFNWLKGEMDGAEADLVRLGFFDDGLAPDHGGLDRQIGQVLNDHRWVTPTSHLAPKGIVLVTTGAFSPFHAGHLRMLEIAKRELEAKGLTVAGAYVTPDHDGYVSTKRGGVCACDAATRIHLAQEATKHIDWIAVDPWAALYQDRPLNYTTILRRTERYLGKAYQVVYVFGSDNQGFKDAFLPHEYVCVGRPGHEDPHPEALNISSTEVRCATSEYPKPTLERPYMIRDDLKWATQDWIVPTTARGQFTLDLSMTFAHVWGHHPFFISAEYQRARLAEVATPHVSFDRVTGSHHWVSRVFNPCTHQHKPVRWLSSDLFSIPAGEYALIDDDIASGSTVEYIKWQTPQIKWIESFGMAQWSLKSGCFDIVDARDFLFGAKQAGLCVKQGDSVYRVPYITPWVNLMQRAKIPPHKQAAFVADIIEANVRFFFRVPVKVGETDNPLFWQALGYSLDTLMYEVSRDLFAWNPN